MIESTTECCGGGAIVINATEGLQIDGLVTADAQQPCTICSASATSGPPRAPSASGLPCCNAEHVFPGAACEGLGGASGGSIWIMASGEMPINGSGAVFARGGDGTPYTSGRGSPSRTRLHAWRCLHARQA